MSCSDVMTTEMFRPLVAIFRFARTRTQV